MVFDNQCSRCHRFGELGTDFGPDLTTVAARFSMRDILESVLFPSDTINYQCVSTIIELDDGQLLNCIVLDEDDDTLTIRTAEIDRAIQIEKSRVLSRRASDLSIMPEGLLDDVDRDDIRNLVGFLQSDAPERAAAVAR